MTTPLSASHAESLQAVGDFAAFDRQARAGERLNVAFLGGSLTWGARASDPMLTSYRALIGQRLAEFYPDAHFTFWDAAIGGTGSRLAVFRLQRDVLRRRPDLVFLDFTINDHPYTVEEETLASYESLVRRSILEGHAPLVAMILAVKPDLGPTPQPRPRDAAHKRIAEAYHLGLGDTVASMRKEVTEGRADPDAMWPYPSDTTHPGDKGYALYAEEAWNAFRKAVEQNVVCRAPEKMLHADTYMTWMRQRLSQLTPLPEGWNPELPTALGVAFDFYMTRWLDDVTVAKPGAAPFRFKFRGSMAMLFGEASPTSGKFLALINGQLANGKNGVDGICHPFCANGNMHFVHVLAQGLDPAVEYTLEIIPQLEDGQELRLESLCVAGGTATVIAG